jgi:hypothetical protein
MVVRGEIDTPWYQLVGAGEDDVDGRGRLRRPRLHDSVAS